MHRLWIRVVCLTFLIALPALSGCGESTEVPLAKVAPVTPSPAGLRTAARPGLQVSPDVLPGVN